LPKSLCESLPKLSETEREETLSWIYKPFSVPFEDVDGSEVPLAFIVKHGSQTLRGDIYFAIFPLRADEERRKAYYPIRIALNFEQPKEGPGAWSDEERTKFWDSLIAAIQALAQQVSTPKRKQPLTSSNGVALARAQKDGTIGVPSNRLFHEVRMTIDNSVHFQETSPARWTADLKSGGFLEVVPHEILESAALSTEGVEQMVAAVRDLVANLSGLTADVYDALVYLCLNGPKTRYGRTLVHVDDLLRLRGIRPRFKDGYRAGYKEKDRVAIRTALAQVMNAAITGKIDSWHRGLKGKREAKPVNFVSKRLFVPSGVHWQGLFNWQSVAKEIYAVEVDLGDPLRELLAHENGRQMALMSLRALEFDPYHQNPEKRLSRYIAYLHRVRASKRTYFQPITVETLVDAAGLKFERRRAGYAKERLEKALDALAAPGDKQVIAGWEYLNWDEPPERLKFGWSDQWLGAYVRIEPMASTIDHYEKICVPRLKNTGTPILPSLLTSSEAARELPSDAAKTLGQRLRALRRTRRWPLAIPAEDLDITSSGLSLIETGKRRPSAHVANRIERWIVEHS